MSRAPARPAAALLAVALSAITLATAGCTEEPIAGVDLGDAPGPQSETVEVTLRADELEGWRDTTFTGFAVPGEASFLFVADGPEIRARSLVRFAGLPDSIVVDSVSQPVVEFVDPTVKVVVDTTDSVIPSARFRLRLFPAPRSWDELEATWELAADGEPWSVPGADLSAEELGSLLVERSQDSDSVAGDVLGDTLVIPLGDAATAALEEWQRRDGEPGAILTVEEPGTRLRIESVVFETRLRGAEQDSAVRRVLRGGGPTFFASSFIFDPPQPAAGERLQIGGLPASRTYFVFEPPDTARGVPIRGATISRAELLFHPEPSPGAPFALETVANGELVELVGDPFELGARVPIGDPISQRLFAVRPDSLAAGQALRIPLDTAFMRRVVTVPPDSMIGPLRIGLRLRPDDQAFGFWSFGSAESETVARRPVLRMLVTPPAPFDIP